MRKILHLLIIVLLFSFGIFVYAQSNAVQELMIKIESKLQEKTLEQQETAWEGLIKKIPKILPDSSNKTISAYVMQLEIQKKITEIKEKIQSRKNDELHKKTEVYYISESEIGKIDPVLKNIKSVRSKILKSVNTERRKELLTTLTLNEKLNTAAQKQAEYLSQTDDFYHVSKKGNTPVDRAGAQGYTFMMLGENIASGPRNITDVMKGWMNSEGHRANILGTGFKELGVGYMSGYRVQMFGTQLQQ